MLCSPRFARFLVFAREDVSAASINVTFQEAISIRKTVERARRGWSLWQLDVALDVVAIISVELFPSLETIIGVSSVVSSSGEASAGARNKGRTECARTT